ncbi:MAG: ATP-binding protein [Marinifilaceae bacterium]
MIKIAIASGKGGTGKTTLSTNLTLFLSRILKKVVLVDLDVEEPNSGLFLKGQILEQEVQFRDIPILNIQKCTHCGRCKEVCNFNAIAQLPGSLEIYEELCHSCHACVGLCPENALSIGKRKIGEITKYQMSGFTFLESRLNIGEPSAVPQIRSTFTYLKKHITDDSLVVMDASPGTSCPVVETFRNVDFVVLVTEPTPFGIHDLKLAVETAREMNQNFGIFINKDGIGDGELERYCKEEHIPILGRIPYSEEIARLYSEGKVLVDEIPIVEQELKRLWSNIQKHTMIKECQN